VGFDFFQAPALGVEAVGAPGDGELFKAGAQRQLALVAGGAAGGNGGVAGHAFGAAGRGRETQIQIAFFGAEFAQRAHGHSTVRGVAGQWRGVEGGG
jgi:hypothetical protein